ncbi:hypothetical protein MMC11_003152 [Xylographa trunciseda]|nr:hypothetical protein [Xylographa trunciseda]
MPPSGFLLTEVMKSQSLRALYISPVIVEQLLQEPEGIDFFKGLDFVCYTGGPFSQTAGNLLMEVPQLATSRDDWAYMEWNPVFHVEMQESEDEEGAFELVLYANNTTENMSALNHNLPGTNLWRTKDLFKPHPTKQSLWCFHGRRDGIVVPANSEKFNPVPFELMVQSHPPVAGAIVVGLGRPQPTLILEPRANAERATLIQDICHTIIEANLLVPGQGRIVRTKIILTTTGKSLIRAGKGTIVRKLTEDAYAKENVAEALREFLNDNVLSNGENRDARTRRVSEMSAMIDKYTQKLPGSLGSTVGSANTAGLCVILTGSTGRLGSYIFQRLLGAAWISKLFCPNCSTNARQINEESIMKHGITIYKKIPSVSFLTVDFSKSRLGLSESVYPEMSNDVDLIVHGAWKVDFNLSLNSFESSHIHGVRQLIDLSFQSCKNPRIVFLSSISSVGNWPNAKSGSLAVPEAPIYNVSVASAMGYGESKRVAECVLQIANQFSCIPDPPWPSREWLPSLVKTSKNTGLIPAGLPSIDWLAVDQLAETVVELSRSDCADREARVNNLVNPYQAPWGSFVSSLQAYYGPQAEVTSLPEWLTAWHNLRETESIDVEATPALKLLDFFESLAENKPAVEYHTEQSRRNSITMASIEPVSKERLETWLRK